jgi:hypothetical protein
MEHKLEQPGGTPVIAEPQGPVRYKILDNTELQEVCINAAKAGLTSVEIATLIGCGQATMYRYLKTNQEFKDALLKARDCANTQVMNTFYHLATNGSCPNATFKWLETQMGMKQSVNVTHSTQMNYDDYIESIEDVTD